MSALLEVHRKYSVLVQESFTGDQGLLTALDKVSLPILCLLIYSSPLLCFVLLIRIFQACGRFVNTNAVTVAAASSTKSPELLARHCDALLKKRWERGGDMGEGE